MCECLILGTQMIHIIAIYNIGIDSQDPNGISVKFSVIYLLFVILTGYTHELLHECRKHSSRIISFIHILTYFSLLDFTLSLYTNIDCTR